MAKFEHGSSNIFNISSPNAYRCQIYHYHRKVSRLYLSVYQGQQSIPVFYLLFSDVGYVEAPMNWQGADFSITDKQSCIDLMLEVGLVGQAILQFPDAYASITDYARLYQVAQISKPIRIIASSASMLKSIPDEVV